MLSDESSILQLSQGLKRGAIQLTRLPLERLQSEHVWCSRRRHNTSITAAIFFFLDRGSDLEPPARPPGREQPRSQRGEACWPRNRPLMGAQCAGGSKPVIFRTVFGSEVSEGWACRRILTPLAVSRGCRRRGQEWGLLCAPPGRGTCCFPGLCWCMARCWSSPSEGSGGAALGGFPQPAVTAERSDTRPASLSAPQLPPLSP